LNLRNEQEKIEKEMNGLGIERYHKNIREAKEKGRESVTLYGVTLMKEALDAVVEGISNFLAFALSGKAGKMATSAQTLMLLDPEIVAYLTLKYCIDGVTTRSPLTRVAMKLANGLEDQFKFDLWENSKESGHLFRLIKNKVNQKTTNRVYRRYNLIRRMTKIEVLEHNPWTSQEKLHLGCKLIDILVQCTGLLEVKTIQYKRNKRLLYLQANDATLAWIEQLNDEGETIHPYFYPCVIPPKDWSSPVNGGYHTNKINSIPMIKTRNREYLEEMQFHPMPQEYGAINALQRTRWVVNRKILEVIKNCWETGESWANLPPREGYKVLPSPIKGHNKKDMSKEDLDLFIKWKKKATVVYDLNAKLSSKRIQLSRTLMMADKFKDYPAIYFVYQMDFRGRKYTVNSFLTPQGPDYAKALLHFAKKLAITNTEQEEYFAVHGANCFGYDKVSFLDRVAWVYRHSNEIAESAKNPLDFRWWTKAEEPWSFLAWCFEWSEFVIQGLGYKSSIPICLDGSNNGLQHFSAMLRDPVGGRATNLTPEALPQDIYQSVADVVKKKVKIDAENGEQFAQEWLDFGISRKITKRPVMVVPYGGTRFSCRVYVEEAIHERILSGQVSNLFGDDTYEASLYLSAHVWEAIGEVVIAARVAMNWLRSIGRQMSDKHLPISWQTPSDFVVQQMYKSMKGRRVSTHIDNVLIKPTVLESTDKVDKRRATNGLSPNFVHSMDASALTLTINKCIMEGINDFAVVHDSYGTHAACVPRMATAIRVAFVDMYKNVDLLSNFYNDLETVLPELEKPPELGSLNIDGVLDSKYFFS
jgi:DNA-directed RNA polymerase